MLLTSWNVNGIRSISSKGFLNWFEARGADVICLQETKAHPDQLDVSLTQIPGFGAVWASAEKKGYSGVVTYFKEDPKEVKVGIGSPEFDNEGRVVSVELKEVWVVNAYFPNSQREHTRLPYKLKFCQAIQEYCLMLERKSGKPVVLCGDYNVAHEEIDLRNPKTNHENPGFLPQERAWMSQFLKSGFVDIFRERHPGEGGHYTWWSYRPGVREKNVGWRIDYHCVTEGLRDRVKDVGIEPHVMGSDHCPVFLELKR